ncbi:MAG: LysR substrate-binding domain-containing protein [Comamonas sp.]
MDLGHLDIFLAVARHGSVTRAAQELGRSQSNVTTRIQQLEADLQAELFLRAGKRMTLTAQGATLLDYAHRLLALAGEARQALQPGQPQGRLRLGTMESTAASRLPALLAAYHQQWPQVALALATGSSGEMFDAVATSRLDAAFVAVLPPPELLDAWHAGQPLPPGQAVPDTAGAPLQGRPAFREALMLVLPQSHPPITRPDQLAIGSMAVFDDRCSYRQLIEYWLTHGPHAIERPRVLELQSYHAILASVASGASIGIVPQSVLDLQPHVAVRTLHIGEVDTWLVWRQGLRSPALDALGGMLETTGPQGQ